MANAFLDSSLFSTSGQRPGVVVTTSDPKLTRFLEYMALCYTTERHSPPSLCHEESAG